MIDIKPYIERLDELKLKMAEWIDRWPHLIGIDLSAIPPITASEVMELYYKTGIMISKI